MTLYFKYMLLLFKAQMEYRASFLLLVLGQCLTPFTVFTGLYFMFERFGDMKGWSFYEVLLCFAVTHMAFSITECFARGFDMFSSLVVSGDFDRLLVRPRGTIIQVLGSKFEFSRVGRLLLGAGVLIWAIMNLDIAWSPLKITALVLMEASGVIIFASIFILCASFSFWTVQGLEIANILTDGGREMTQYPLSIYHRRIQQFFTFIIPFGCANYLPLQYILGREENPIYAFLPLAGLLFLVPCLLIWQIGVRRYRSTGS